MIALCMIYVYIYAYACVGDCTFCMMDFRGYVSDCRKSLVLLTL